MKSIVKIILAFIFVPLLFVGCDDDDIDPIIEPNDLRLVDPGFNTISLNVNTPDQNAFLITWDDYSTDSEMNYTVQISNTESFEEVVDLGTTTENYYSPTMQQVNQALLNWDYIPYVAQTIYLRLSSGNLTSNVIDFLVKTYPVENAVITAPQSMEQISLDADLAEEIAYTFIWSDYAYENGDAEVAYKLQFALPDTDFAEVQEVNAYTSEKALTHTDLNDIAIELGLEPNEVGNIAVRVITQVVAPSGEELTFTSDAVTFQILTYMPTEPKLFVVGSVQEYYGSSAWTPLDAVELRYIGDGTTRLFEGYMKVGENDEFKLIEEQQDWGDMEGNYGTINGEQDGNLEFSGGSSNIAPGEEGFYYIRVDIDNLTYQLVNMEWGIIGSATPNGWDAETPMTYNFENNQFEYNGSLSTGELKFRSANTGQAIYNSDWSFNIGSDDVAWDVGSSNISIDGGDYNITLNIDLEGNVTKGGL